MLLDTGLTTAKRRVRAKLDRTVAQWHHGKPSVDFVRLRCHAEQRAHDDRAEGPARVAERQRILRSVRKDDRWVPIFCAACDRWTNARVHVPTPGDDGADSSMNWRETVICADCALNSRQRLAYHIFDDQLAPSRDAAIYLTERVTPFYRSVSTRFSNVVGSEFLSADAVPGVADARGIRHEDLTCLSFATATFDYVLSFDVLEHVPAYRSALDECVRVLKPGGRLLLTAPFHNGAATTVRARLTPGGVEHLLPPEYHGDPVRDEGCLCFYHFGWDILDALRAAGCSDAFGFVAYSVPLGYFTEHVVLVATK